MHASALLTKSRVITTNFVPSVRFLVSAIPMEKRVAPKWNMPKSEVKVELPPLKLFNSFSNNKDLFVPKRGKEVTWYSCGPTVYDSSHMGHARSYISFDIIRRVLSDYFGFKVFYVMNITDIDDKIIKKARQNFLIEQYFLNASSIKEVKEDIRNAITLYEDKSKTHPEPDQREFLKREINRLRQVLSTRISMSGLLTGSQDALATYLDSKHGSSISDYKIFESLPRRMEEEFHCDMRSLNVKDADKLTRVSDYIEPIIKYILKIIDNGFAYVAESGSVYFDTKKFANTEGHFYAKLVPTAYGDVAKLASGEGDLGSLISEKRTFSDFALWKASKLGEPAWPSPWGDGRPGWHIECSVMASDSIGDCMDIHTGGADLKFPHHDNELAQSEAYFGHSHWVSYFLHAGHLTISGCKMSKSLKNFITIREALKQHSSRDLRFAFLLHSWRDTLDYGADTMNQALAFGKMITDYMFNVSHALRLLSRSDVSNGPLPDNEDLSKALVTADKEIFDALCDSVDTRRAMNALRELITASNQAECTQPLVSSSPHLLARVHQSYSIAAFILHILRIFGAIDITSVSQAWSSPPQSGENPISAKQVLELSAHPVWVSMEAPRLETLATAFYGALLACKQFTSDVTAASPNEKVKDVMQILSEFNTFVLNEFGVDTQKLPDSVSETFKIVLEHSLKDSDKVKCVLAGDSAVLEREVWAVVARLLYQAAYLRQSLRVFAQASTTKSSDVKGAILSACDRFRDDYLPAHGIRLQDRMDTKLDSADLPAIGLVSAKLIAAEKNEKAEKEAERVKLKTQQAQAKEEAGRLSPSEMFRSQTDKFSIFDDKGIPTHDVAGKEITKSQAKKLQKQYELQAKRHEAYLASQK